MARQSTASGPILTNQVDATFQQVRAMGVLITNLAQVFTSLLRIPLLLAQIVTLLLAVPFLLAQTITGVLTQSVEKIEQNSWNKTVPGMASQAAGEPARPRADLGSFGIPRPHFGSNEGDPVPAEG